MASLASLGSLTREAKEQKETVLAQPSQGRPKKDRFLKRHEDTHSLPYREMPTRPRKAIRTKGDHPKNFVFRWQVDSRRHSTEIAVSHQIEGFQLERFSTKLGRCTEFTAKLLASSATFGKSLKPT